LLTANCQLLKKKRLSPDSGSFCQPEVRSILQADFLRAKAFAFAGMQLGHTGVAPRGG
jgi:hypothetical protein